MFLPLVTSEQISPQIVTSQKLTLQSEYVSLIQEEPIYLDCSRYERNPDAYKRCAAKYGSQSEIHVAIFFSRKTI